VSSLRAHLVRTEESRQTAEFHAQDLEEQLADLQACAVHHFNTHSFTRPIAGAASVDDMYLTGEAEVEAEEGAEAETETEADDDSRQTEEDSEVELEAEAAMEGTEDGTEAEAEASLLQQYLTSHRGDRAVYLFRAR
jgi:hypothetical protein